MRNTLVASVLLVAAACSGERSAPAPALNPITPEPIVHPVRVTRTIDPLPLAPVTPVAPRGPTATSTSPNGAVWIETTCENTPVETQLVLLEREYPGATHVDLGKAALLVDRGTRQQLMAWAIDSNCRVEITAPKDVDTVALARTLLPHLRGRS